MCLIMCLQQNQLYRIRNLHTWADFNRSSEQTNSNLMKCLPIWRRLCHYMILVNSMNLAQRELGHWVMQTSKIKRLWFLTMIMIFSKIRRSNKHWSNRFFLVKWFQYRNLSQRRNMMWRQLVKGCISTPGESESWGTSSCMSRCFSKRVRTTIVMGRVQFVSREYRKRKLQCIRISKEIQQSLQVPISRVSQLLRICMVFSKPKNLREHLRGKASRLKTTPANLDRLQACFKIRAIRNKILDITWI